MSYLPNDPRQRIIDSVKGAPDLQFELEKAFDFHHGIKSLEQGMWRVRAILLERIRVNPNDEKSKSYYSVIEQIIKEDGIERP